MELFSAQPLESMILLSIFMTEEQVKKYFFFCEFHNSTHLKEPLCQNLFNIFFSHKDRKHFTSELENGSPDFPPLAFRASVDLAENV